MSIIVVIQGSAHSGRQWSGPTTSDLKAAITHLTATSSKRSDEAPRHAKYACIQCALFRDKY